MRAKHFAVADVEADVAPGSPVGGAGEASGAASPHLIGGGQINHLAVGQLEGRLGASHGAEGEERGERTGEMAHLATWHDRLPGRMVEVGRTLWIGSFTGDRIAIYQR